MAALQVQTFSDIVTAVMESLGLQSTDTVAKNKIKRFINEVYLDEVIPFKRWLWLEKTTQIIHEEPYITGTVSVVQDSTTITFSTAPTGKNFTNYRFSIDASNQLYTISAHTTSATTATVSTAFQEDSDATANFKVWRDRVDLPTNARETTEIWHSQQSFPLDAVGSQGFRELEAKDPKLEGYPRCYDTWTFYDPSTTGDDETESDRYRQTRIYPSISTDGNCLLNVDYIIEATALEDDNDEPLIPINDRIVLKYGAEALAWSVISRNEEMHDKCFMKFQSKLARMAGNRDEGQDTPKLSPSPKYINAIRRSRIGRRW